jgi:deoxyribose-phosphate aldolase
MKINKYLDHTKIGKNVEKQDIIKTCREAFIRQEVSLKELRIIQEIYHLF